MQERIDELTLAIVGATMRQACYDMRHVVERTAQSYLMGQLHDLSVGIYDRDGRTIAIPIGIAVHFMSGGFSIRTILRKFGDDIEEGDVFLSNEPFRGGYACHLPDWAFIRPVFVDGELLFWTLVRGHQSDTGGSFPGGYYPGSYDVHAEGLCIPPMKVVQRGFPNEELWELIYNNVRWPDKMRIDHRSMMGACGLGERRLIETVEKYGTSTVLSSVDELMDRTQAAVADAISKIPDGTYYGSASTDDDGDQLDEPVTIRCTMVVDSDRIMLDFSDSDSVRRGFINAVWTTTFANAIAAAALVMDPELGDLHNEGTIRQIDVRTKPGTVVDADYPLPHMASPVAVGIPVMEAVLQACAQALPERAIAAAGRHRTPLIFGKDPRNHGEGYFFPTFNTVGSLGAVEGFDGYTGAVILHARGAITRGSIEEEEVRFPWRVKKWEFATDMMGAGKYRGGLGIYHEMVHEGDDGYLATGAYDGDTVEGHGVLGGQPTRPHRTWIQRGSERMRVKSHRLQKLNPGDVLIHVSSGGGGAGDPRERPRDKVLADLRDGMVSPEAARDIYGLTEAELGVRQRQSGGPAIVDS